VSLAVIIKKMGRLLLIIIISNIIWTNSNAQTAFSKSTIIVGYYHGRVETGGHASKYDQWPVRDQYFYHDGQQNAIDIAYLFNLKKTASAGFGLSVIKETGDFTHQLHNSNHFKLYSSFIFPSYKKYHLFTFDFNCGLTENNIGRQSSFVFDLGPTLHIRYKTKPFRLNLKLFFERHTDGTESGIAYDNRTPFMTAYPYTIQENTFSFNFAIDFEYNYFKKDDIITPAN
jgi:hypothetical protein